MFTSRLLGRAIQIITGACFVFFAGATLIIMAKAAIGKDDVSGGFLAGCLFYLVILACTFLAGRYIVRQADAQAVGEAPEPGTSHTASRRRT